MALQSSSSLSMTFTAYLSHDADDNLSLFDSFSQASTIRMSNIPPEHSRGTGIKQINASFYRQMCSNGTLSSPSNSSIIPASVDTKLPLAKALTTHNCLPHNSLTLIPFFSSHCFPYHGDFLSQCPDGKSGKWCWWLVELLSKYLNPCRYPCRNNQQWDRGTRCPVRSCSAASSAWCKSFPCCFANTDICVSRQPGDAVVRVHGEGTVRSSNPYKSATHLWILCWYEWRGFAF